MPDCKIGFYIASTASFEEMGKDACSQLHFPNAFVPTLWPLDLLCVGRACTGHGEQVLPASL